MLNMLIKKIVIILYQAKICWKILMISGGQQSMGSVCPKGTEKLVRMAKRLNLKFYTLSNCVVAVIFFYFYIVSISILAKECGYSEVWIFDLKQKKIF